MGLIRQDRDEEAIAQAEDEALWEAQRIAAGEIVPDTTDEGFLLPGLTDEPLHQTTEARGGTGR